MKLYLIIVIGFSLILNVHAINYSNNNKMAFANKTAFDIKSTHFMNFWITKNPALSTQTQTSLALMDLKRQTDAQKTQTDTLATQIYRQNKVVQDIIQETLLQKILLQQAEEEKIKNARIREAQYQQKDQDTRDRKTTAQKTNESDYRQPISTSLGLIQQPIAKDCRIDEDPVFWKMIAVISSRPAFLTPPSGENPAFLSSSGEPNIVLSGNPASTPTVIATDYSPLQEILKSKKEKREKFLRFSTKASFLSGNFKGTENTVLYSKKSEDEKKAKKNKRKKARQDQEAQKALTCPKAAVILLHKLMKHEKYQQKISDILIREGLALPRPSKKQAPKQKKVTTQSPLNF